MMILFLAKTLLCSILFWCYYIAALRNKPMHQFNRAYLLLAAVCSLIIPALHIKLPYTGNLPARVIPLLQVTGSGTEEQIHQLTQTSKTLSLQTILTGAYILVSLVLLLRLISSVISIFKWRALGSKEQLHSCTLIKTQHPGAPFSFLNLLFWPEHMRSETPEGATIMAHELAHIRQRHSIDKLIMQLILCIAWINPINWLLRKELALQHEYLADQAAVTGHDTDQFARMLLYATFGAAAGGISNNFFQSSVKKRLSMLTTSAQPIRHPWLRRAAALPLVLLLLGLFSFKTPGNTTRAAQPITIILDAAHGGTDPGATSSSGAQEKDYCLRIAQTLQSLAPDYNIQVIMTRQNDITLPLQDRITFSNNTEADLCLSIHVNKGALHAPATYELGIPSHGGGDRRQSQMLASAVGNRLKSGQRTIALTNMSAAIIRQNKHTALLIECGNIDDPAYLQTINDPATRNTLCRDILAGIVDYKTRQ